MSSGGFLIDSESQIQAGYMSEHKNDVSNREDDNFKINPDQDVMKDLKK